MSLDIFIGYDPREAVAFHVCVNSIIRHTSQPVTIHPLALSTLGCYDSARRDGSNDFIYSRFLVPELMGWKGRALYIDGDMVVRCDVAELFDIPYDHKAVHVVKHDYKTRAREKYLGSINEDYPRKNWSSVILWNCWHFAHRPLTADTIADKPGSFLHRFAWIDDSLIGDLPKEWNWLPDEYGPNPDAKLLHWTLGTPCFTDYAEAPQAEAWHHELGQAVKPL